MNHTQARQLIQAAADGLLSEAHRRALDSHLAGCSQCQAYFNNLNELEARLSNGLQARWQGVQPRRFSLEQARARAARKESPGLRRLYQLVAVPAFQFGALAAVAVTIALIIGSAANGGPTAETGTETPIGTPETSIALAETTEVACKAVANIDARVYREHSAASDVIGALPHGQTSPVLTYYMEPETNVVWMQIAYNLGTGWITNADATLMGDCTNVPTEGVATPTPATPQATVTATLGASQVAVASSPQPTTRPGCLLSAPYDLTMYASPTLNSAIVGNLVSGSTAPISAWAHDGQSPAWFQITSNGQTGWILAAWYFPSQGNPCGDLPLTALPTPVSSPTPSVTPQVCVVAPSDYVATDRSVYTGPAKTYPILGQVPTGVYITATGIFSQDNYNTWIRVDFNGQEGWMDGTYLMFGGGGCWPLPPVDFQPHPPTFTPSPTFEVSPTAVTEEPPMYFDVSVPGTIGTVQTFSAGFPYPDNQATEHVLRITVTDIPHSSGNDGRRIVDYTMTCIGSGSGQLTWDWALAQSTPHTCGETLRSNGLLWSSNSVQFLISAPVGGSDTVTYSVTIQVSAYPG